MSGLQSWHAIILYCASSYIDVHAACCFEIIAEKYTSGLSAENLEGLSQTVASFATLERLKSTIRTREGEVSGVWIC